MNNYKLKSQFQAQDEDGNIYDLNTFVQMIDTGTLEEVSFIEGTKTTKTAEGQHCNRLDDGRYKIVHSGKVLTPLDL